PGDIVAPMQAIVVALAVSEGDQVEEGQLVAVLEAMKMEKPLLAPRAGTVTSLSVKQGDTVTAGTRIAHIATEEEAQ
ncbi:MAG: acetyl-CoA carboxylase biotin carboxyl carrier protein subunit, partial [Thermobifida sp.]|nr:acetyl-CoA carboxylase biotin carboxyl carrier protein subunit [Thermobifida sp.]